MFAVAVSLFVFLGGGGGGGGGGADHEARLCFMVCPHPDDDKCLRFGVSGITP